MMGYLMTALGWGTRWRNICHIYLAADCLRVKRYGICCAKPLHLGKFSPGTRWAIV